MVSPLFSAVTSSGSHILSGLIFLLLPRYLPIPGGWKILVSGPFNIFLPFQFFCFSAFFFFTFLDSVFVSYFCLLTLSFYPLRKWYIRVLFLWADLQHSHLNADMTWGYLAIVHFFHSICKLPWSRSKGIIIRKIKYTKASSIILP